MEPGAERLTTDLSLTPALARSETTHFLSPDDWSPRSDRLLAGEPRIETISETATRATLIVDDDEQIAEALAQYIAGPDRTVITCNDIESAQIVLEQIPIAEVLADVQYSGRFSFEGLALIRHIRECAPKARIILMSGHASAALRHEATTLGAHALLEKPFDPEVLESLLSVGQH